MKGYDPKTSNKIGQSEGSPQGEKRGWISGKCQGCCQGDQAGIKSEVNANFWYRAIHRWDSKYNI